MGEGSLTRPQRRRAVRPRRVGRRRVHALGQSEGEGTEDYLRPAEVKIAEEVLDRRGDLAVGFFLSHVGGKMTGEGVRRTTFLARPVPPGPGRAEGVGNGGCGLG
jgi:hypothetical protein